QVNAKDVASLNHNGIDMYFYPMEGYGNRMFVVTDGKPLAKESIAGEKPIIGELKELSRIPFARSAYAELGIRTGVKYFAVKEGKEPNPKMVLTYAVLLLIGSLFIIPIIMEVRNLNNNKTHTAGASA
ncbi:MAG: hypothetical protein HY779_03745, partial [Rubrobacteridae bacterium]|nr:hypothetical protein [Rubrobacteridae bacterium]